MKILFSGFLYEVTYYLVNVALMETDMAHTWHEEHSTKSFATPNHSAYISHAFLSLKSLHVCLFGWSSKFSGSLKIVFLRLIYEIQIKICIDSFLRSVSLLFILFKWMWLNSKRKDCIEEASVKNHFCLFYSRFLHCLHFLSYIYVSIHCFASVSHCSLIFIYSPFPLNLKHKKWKTKTYLPSTTLSFQCLIQLNWNFSRNYVPLLIKETYIFIQYIRWKLNVKIFIISWCGTCHVSYQPKVATLAISVGFVTLFDRMMIH